MRAENKQMCVLKKCTSLDWGNEWDEWYIIPTLAISFNRGFTINFEWLKIQYSHYWAIVTYEEEDEWAQVHYKLKDKNKNEK